MRAMMGPGRRWRRTDLEVYPCLTAVPAWGSTVRTNRTGPTICSALVFGTGIPCSIQRTQTSQGEGTAPCQQQSSRWQMSINILSTYTCQQTIFQGFYTRHLIFSTLGSVPGELCLLFFKVHSWHQTWPWTCRIQRLWLHVFVHADMSRPEMCLSTSKIWNDQNTPHLEDPHQTPPQGCVKKEVPAEPLPGHMTLGKSFKHSELQCIPLHNRNDDDHFPDLWGGCGWFAIQFSAVFAQDHGPSCRKQLPEANRRPFQLLGTSIAICTLHISLLFSLVSVITHPCNIYLLSTPTLSPNTHSRFCKLLRTKLTANSVLHTLEPPAHIRIKRIPLALNHLVLWDKYSSLWRKFAQIHTVMMFQTWRFPLQQQQKKLFFYQQQA